MLKKVIKYEDYNGEMKEKECYFNLSKSELAKMDILLDGGILNYTKKINDEHDNKSLINFFEEIILRSYGVKSKDESEDGERFIKSEELSLAFKQSPAYDALFMELILEENASKEFIKGLMPSSIKKELDREKAN